MLAACFNEIIQYSLPMLLFQWIILKFFYIVKCQCIGFKFRAPFLDKDKAFSQTENSSSCSWTCNPTKSFDINSFKVSLHTCSSQIDSFRQSGYLFIPCFPQFYKAWPKKKPQECSNRCYSLMPLQFDRLHHLTGLLNLPRFPHPPWKPFKTLNSHLCKWLSSFML